MRSWASSWRVAYLIVDGACAKIELYCRAGGALGGGEVPHGARPQATG